MSVVCVAAQDNKDTLTQALRKLHLWGKLNRCAIPAVYTNSEGPVDR